MSVKRTSSWLSPKMREAGHNSAWRDEISG
jgi:hypothetical protein